MAGWGDVGGGRPGVLRLRRTRIASTQCGREGKLGEIKRADEAAMPGSEDDEKPEESRGS